LECGQKKDTSYRYHRKNKNKPKDMAVLLESRSVKNVSIPRELWEYLGNYQYKVSQSYTPSRWGDPELSLPSYSESQIKALRLAYELFELGRTKERRERFVSLLVKEPAMKHEWFRMLIQGIR